MKKLAYILSLVAAAAFTVVSCEKEPEAHPFGPAETAGCYGVFFPSQEASGSHVFSPVQDPSIDIIVKRTNTNGSITVPVKTTFSEDGIFTMNDISFADGQDETTFTVRFDNAKEGANYSASFTIEDNNYASLYNSNPISLDFSVMRVEMKTFMTEDGKEKANVTFSDPSFLEEIHDDIYIQYYEIDGIRYCETIGGKTVYSNNGLEDGTGVWGTDVQMKFKWYTKKTVTVNDVDYQWIEVEPVPTGFNSSNGPIYMGDYYWMRSDMGLGNGSYTSSYDRYVNGSDGYLPSYYDGHGGFIFNSAYWIHGTTSWYGYKDSTPLAIAAGYIRVDYTFELEADYTSMGVTPISVEAGADVTSIKYAVYEGELTATQIGYKVDAIIDGSDESVSFDEFEFDEEEAKNYATLGVAPEKTGMYTIVAVAYSEDGKPQNSANAIFKHIAAGDQEEYEVDLTVFTEDTPARYASYHSYDSFAYGVIGKDLTDAHIAIFKLDDVMDDVDGYFDAVKADSKGNYAVSADVLKAINGEGGYYTVAKGLAAKTDYIVIAWATNGDMDAWDYDIYTTDKLPYNWNSLGKGLINDGFFNYLFNNKPETTASCDVYEEAKTPGLYMVTGFQCAVAAGFFGVSEELMAQYENGNWRNAEVVIDATNPNAVTIEEQDYGILVNSAYGFFQIRSSKPGTLKDGVITFPKEGLDCYLDGYGWIAANDEGTFSVTLPSAVPAAPAAAPARNGEVKDVVLTKPAVRSEESMMSFERDPQPIKVNVTVSHERKAKASFRELAPESLR